MAGKTGRSGKGQYKKIQERAAQGDYTLIDPLDYKIIEVLHDEGEMFAGAYPLASGVSQINREAFDGQLKNQMLGPRFNSLAMQGLIVQVLVPGNMGKHAYQRTAEGKKVLNEWRRRNGSEPQPSAEQV
jgi:hypothetical protein